MFNKQIHINMVCSDEKMVKSQKLPQQWFPWSKYMYIYKYIAALYISEIWIVKYKMDTKIQNHVLVTPIPGSLEYLPVLYIYMGWYKRTFA